MFLFYVINYITRLLLPLTAVPLSTSRPSPTTTARTPPLPFVLTLGTYPTPKCSVRVIQYPTMSDTEEVAEVEAVEEEVEMSVLDALKEVS
jgi:hypothetical protein